MMTAEEEDVLALRLAIKAQQLTEQGKGDAALLLEMLVLMFAWRYPKVRELLTPKKELS